MITKAAIRWEGVVYTGRRHCFIMHCQEDSTKHLPLGFLKFGEQGFVDDRGNFLSREEAAMHVIECGQLKKGETSGKHIFNGNTLFSESLY